MAIGEINIIKFGVNIPWGRYYTDLRAISKDIIRIVCRRPLWGGEKTFHYMAFVPNVFQVLKPDYFDAVERSLVGDKRYKGMNVKIICQNEEVWCNFIRENVFKKLSEKERREGVWDIYRDRTFAFIRKLHESYGDGVIRTLHIPLPYHLAITEKFGYLILHDTEIFKKVYKESPDPVNIIGIKIRNSDPKISILKHWFHEYYTNEDLSQPLDVDRLMRGFSSIPLL
jgi:hypothetical protein